MTYYILPKNLNSINIMPELSYDKIDICISNILYKYYKDIKKQIIKICISNKNNVSFNRFDELIRIINPYEYIFNKVPGSKYSVSKLKPNTNIFYDFLEISNTLNIFDSFKNTDIQSLNIGTNNIDSIECIEMIRENYVNDKFFYFEKINNHTYSSIQNLKFDFIFYELENDYDNLNLYTVNLIKIILIILKQQNSNGISIIKINKIFYKPIIDILYLLNSLYEKVYIIKPNTSNITSFEKYIICKKFICSENKVELYKNNYNILSNFLINYNKYNNEKYDNKNDKNYENKGHNKINITSIIQQSIPIYFINKINDINIIIGQQQIVSLNQIINILKNKNKDDKIESIKKLNIQKSVTWCEKFKIPCNKFSEKTNIFLPLNNEEKNIVEKVIIEEEEIIIEENINFDQENYVYNN